MAVGGVLDELRCGGRSGYVDGIYGYHTRWEAEEGEWVEGPGHHVMCGSGFAVCFDGHRGKCFHEWRPLIADEIRPICLTTTTDSSLAGSSILASYSVRLAGA